MLHTKLSAHTIFVMTTTPPHAPPCIGIMYQVMKLDTQTTFAAMTSNPLPPPIPPTLPPTLYWNYVLCYK